MSSIETLCSGADVAEAFHMVAVKIDVRDLPRTYAILDGVFKHLREPRDRPKNT